jgi:hypothetical protein
MKTVTFAASAALLFTAAVPAHAQDSVSKLQATPGDAVSPYADAAAADGSEQRNRYVVDTATFTSSWGNEFTIAPISKSSRVDEASGFFNILTSGNAISRSVDANVTTTGLYESWNGVGFGINYDPAKSDPGTLVPFPTEFGSRFAAAYSEFGTTNPGEDYSGIISNIVHVDPVDPRRLYVERVVAAINGCDDVSNVADFGFGSVLSDGTVAFRSDTFGVAQNSSCGNTTALDNNLWVVEASKRDAGSINVMSGNKAFGYDDVATNHVVQFDPTTWNTPTIGRIDGTPSVLGTNFNSEFGSGADFGFVFPTSLHLGTAADHRGNLSRLEKNFPLLGSTDGLCAILGRDAGFNNQLVVFGLQGVGGPTGITSISGTLNLVLPGTVVDNSDGYTNDTSGQNQFNHYRSQIAFRGGNGQVGMNIDQSGNLIVAAAADQGPFAGEAFCPDNYLAVARVSPAGNVEWTMAAYNTPTGGKQVLDGPGGTAVGRLIPLSTIVGNDLPSMSSPMVDSAGNIYFWGAYERFSTGTTVTALMRAVYDEASFSYELEQLFTLGQVFPGLNSGRDYQVRFIALADSNSISSSAPFSGNITEDGFGGQTYPGAPIDSPLHLGGLVLTAEIVYDVDQNGTFDDASNQAANPGSPDEDYQVMLYIGAAEASQPNLGFQGPGETELRITGEGLAAGETSTLTLSGAAPNSIAFVALSSAGQPDLNFFCGTFASGFGLAPGFPFTFGTDANGRLEVPIPGDPAVVDFVVQAASVDPAILPCLSISNAVLARFGR